MKILETNPDPTARFAAGGSAGPERWTPDAKGPRTAPRRGSAHLAVSDLCDPLLVLLRFYDNANLSLEVKTWTFLELFSAHFTSPETHVLRPAGLLDS
jgi:hypothetical protein